MAIGGAQPATARIVSVDDLSSALADAITAVVRAAYSAADLVPGLPASDGSRVTPAELFDDLAAGQSLWVAESAGRVVGTVRAVRSGSNEWEVRRLAVAPWSRHAGIARHLLRRLEAAAWAAGSTRVVLDAVVERGNPAFYAKVGYQTVRHFPAPDKPLSEVRMQRDLGESPVPARHDAPPLESGLLLHWLATSTGTVCRAALTSGPLTSGAQSAAALGADFMAGAGPDQLATVRPALAAAAILAGRSEWQFDRPASEIAAFRTPRLVDGELLAWWRSPAAREQAGRASLG